MKKTPFDEDFKFDFYKKRNKSRPIREHSIFHLKGYSPELEKPYPPWYYESVKALKGTCIYCASELPKGKRRYCGTSCKWKAAGASTDLQGTSVRKFIHKLFEFKCNHCEDISQFITPAGARIPILAFEVDHVRPICKGGPDEVSNLQLLCRVCHSNKTIKDRRADL